jgi:nucleotide-binding universal stress UspA family protein
MIGKVLIATDGSHHAGKAVELGAEVAARFDAEVVLVHVLLRHELPDDLRRMAAVEHLAGQAPLPSAAVPAVDLANIINLGGGNGTASEQALAAIGDRILEQAEEVARARGVAKIVKRIEDGKPVDRILAVARSEGVDLIVTGARGLSDLQALFVGSVSHKLSHLSPVACLTVR